MSTTQTKHYAIPDEPLRTLADTSSLPLPDGQPAAVKKARQAFAAAITKAREAHATHSALVMESRSHDESVRRAARAGGDVPPARDWDRELAIAEGA